MRIVFFLAVLILVALVGYVGITGYFLAHAAVGLLKVGAISTLLATAEPPTDPLALGYRGDPTTALALPFQTVTLDMPLGPTEAWLVPAAGPEVGRAIYVHGIAGAREDGYRALSILHEAGWSVLLISYRNDPDAPASPEGTYGFGLTEWPDLEAAVTHVAPGEADRVLVVAESMGGAILGQFLAQSPLAARVQAVALDSPAISFGAVIDHLAAQGGKPLPGLVAVTARQILPYKTPLPLAQAEVAATFQAFPGPLFLAHGSADRIVPQGPSQTLATSRSAPTVTLWTEADHLGSYAGDPAAYRKSFQDFLAQIVG
ncbi:MAG: hypothetical protein U1E69_08440 [Tabrizicola sp.]|uniref:alpha/beta hydrolase n=1 Tax=Tabrizicola sp. TaxID=2005166 RepID=UPI002AB892CE|nr:hypothetical protein [Tabrizicola sp.]MDZ4086817.1 hypothetical protein [Tabrizicola sp.]